MDLEENQMECSIQKQPSENPECINSQEHSVQKGQYFLRYKFPKGLVPYLLLGMLLTVDTFRVLARLFLNGALHLVFFKIHLG